jgi:hypothetical protein
VPKTRIFADWLSGCKLLSVCKLTIGKCILSGEDTLHWTTENCVVQSDWQCTLTTNLESTIPVVMASKPHSCELGAVLLPMVCGQSTTGAPQSKTTMHRGRSIQTHN